MIKILFLIFFGVVLGCITGLVPGIHVNTIVVFILAFVSSLLEIFSRPEIVAIVIAMSLTHSFVDYIPTILLGAPDEDSVLSILPGHRMLLKGRAYEAIRLTVIGGLGAIAMSMLILPVSLAILPTLYLYTRKVISFLLLGVIGYMIFTEKELEKRFSAFLVVMLSGALGIITLNSGILNSKYSLFVVFSGLFGISTLINSMRTKPRIPKQSMEYEAIRSKGSVIAGTSAGLLAGILPSLGSSQAAIIVQNLLKQRSERGFLITLGGVNTAYAIFSILALYLIGNPRSGAAIAVENILYEIKFQEFLYMVSIVAITSILAAYLTLFLARGIIGRIKDIDYLKISRYIIIFLFALIFFFTGFRGIFIALISVSIGLIQHFAGIKKSHVMAVLMVPTIMYFW